MELLFYHLQVAPIERVLPDLLFKSLEKGWRAVIETCSVQEAEAIDAMLWTFADDSFLPHGKSGEPFSQDQKILVTADNENLNQAEIRFFVDAGDVTAHSGYQRLVYIFNGHDEKAVTRARGQWQAGQDAEMTMTYWQQNEAGRWEQKA